MKLTIDHCCCDECCNSMTPAGVRADTATASLTHTYPKVETRTEVQLEPMGTRPVKLSNTKVLGNDTKRLKSNKPVLRPQFSLLLLVLWPSQPTIRVRQTEISFRIEIKVNKYFTFVESIPLSSNKEGATLPGSIS
jgi:hypothetical protein